MLWKSNVEDLLVRLDVMLKTGVGLRDALIFLKRSKKTEKLARKGLWSMEEEGRTFSEGIRPHISAAEFALLLSGEKSDNLRFAIQKTLYLRRMQKKMRSTMIGAMIYPISMLILTFIALYFAGNKVVPQLEKEGVKIGTLLKVYKVVASPEVLIPLAIILIGTFIGLVIFMTKFLGPYRKLTDRIFPFSVYRQWMGVIFLFMLSSLTKSGYTIGDALEEIRDSNAYFDWVVGSYSEYYKTSKNLGEAMKKSGFPIPNEDTADELEVLSSFGKFEERLMIIAEDMVESYVKNAEVFGKVGSILTLLITGFIVIGFLAGMYTTVMDMMQTIGAY